jgi:Leucine-rich repeat (LRR) protein
MVTANAEPRRRIQFSLKALLLLVALVAVPCGWFKWKWDAKQRERAAIEEIETMGGQISFNWQATEEKDNPPGPKWLRKVLGEDFFAHVTEVLIDSDDITDEWLTHLEPLTQLKYLRIRSNGITDGGVLYLTRFRELVGVGISNADSLDDPTVASGRLITDVGLGHVEALPHLTELWIVSTGVTDAGLIHVERMNGIKSLGLINTFVTDAGLEHLKSLTGLTQLYLASTKVTDAGLPFLRGLTELQILFLTDTHITDAGMAHLSILHKLTLLDLGGTAVTDAGLVHLKSMTQLKELHLQGTAVTDAGLVHLRQLAELRTLALETTAVTDKGVAELETHLPNCQIFR